MTLRHCAVILTHPAEPLTPEDAIELYLDGLDLDGYGYSIVPLGFKDVYADAMAETIERLESRGIKVTFCDEAEARIGFYRWVDGECVHGCRHVRLVEFFEVGEEAA